MRKTLQIIPENLDKLWNEWDVRIMVLSSLCLQIVLVHFGSRRKFSSRNSVKIITWIAYLSADWVATVALGVISSFRRDCHQGNSSHPNSPMIMAFWTPFLLVHLGGPDSITAYSLEDNELWLRHLLGLLVQVAVALYIFLRSWTASTYQLSLLSIPMFIAGIIKYGERTWVLRSTTSDRNLSAPNTDHGNAHVSSYHNDAEEKDVEDDLRSRLSFWRMSSKDLAAGRKPSALEATLIHQACVMFKKVFVRLYADLTIDFFDSENSYPLIVGSSSDYFKVVEIELGFMYDLLYTKATMVYSFKGIIFRSICMLSYISTFLIFGLVINKKLYFTIDIALTYLLFVGAITLELYGISLLLSTDWTLYWLSRKKNMLAGWIFKGMNSLLSIQSHRKRWSESMAQFSLIDFCVKEKPLKWHGFLRLLGIFEMYEKYRHTSHEKVPFRMKELIFQKLQDARNHVNEERDPASKYDKIRDVLSWKGNHALQRLNIYTEFYWTMGEHVPLEKTIHIWHIATDLCFYNEQKHPDHHEYKSHVMSKLLSDYMMYILVMKPFLLPKGSGHIRFKDTCAQAREFFRQRRQIISKGEAGGHQVLSEMWRELDSDGSGTDSNMGSKTVLTQGCWLAEKLQSQGWNYEQKWYIIGDVWIEMLCYSASQCGWKEHVRQLRCGGELLTLVSLLMANLGFSEQFQQFIQE